MSDRVWTGGTFYVTVLPSVLEHWCCVGALSTSLGCPGVGRDGAPDHH